MKSSMRMIVWTMPKMLLILTCGRSCRMTEYQHQLTLIKWTQQPGIRQKYPELRLLFHIANERKDKKETIILKRAGVKSGVPDLFLPVARQGYHGLWIEMKSDKGRTSDSQDWWIDNLRAEGYCVQVCYNWESARDMLEGYLG